MSELQIQVEVKKPLSPSPLVLFVDGNGTLFAGDLLAESILRAIKRNPFVLILAVIWRLRGRAYLKYRLANISRLDASHLPYFAHVIDFLRQEKAKGRRLVLATGCNLIYARAIAAHLAFFDDVIASDTDLDLSGAAKREAILAYCRARGLDGFGYVGCVFSDVDVWQHDGTEFLVQRFRPGGPVAVYATSMLGQISSNMGSQAAAIVQAIRPHQWAKNLLVFVPIIVSHQLNHIGDLIGCTLAFGSFSACASAVYLFNDLFDIDSDRLHPQKRPRPFASGKLPISHGFAWAAGLLAYAFLQSWFFLPSDFALVLLAYLVANCAYTIILKSKIIIDVVVLSFLYVLRVLAGGIAADLVVSNWLLAFSLFIFMSLALAKRYSELMTLTAGKDALAYVPGRGYRSDDAEVMGSIGTASGVCAVLVLALYIDSSQVRLIYDNPRQLWLLCPILLYWIARLWIIARRGRAGDPVLFAVTDWPSLCVALLSLLLIYRE
jgi:4-hydroxybenzoate polyprenyltransferase